MGEIEIGVFGSDQSALPTSSDSVLNNLEARLAVGIRHDTIDHPPDEGHITSQVSAALGVTESIDEKDATRMTLELGLAAATPNVANSRRSEWRLGWSALAGATAAGAGGASLLTYTAGLFVTPLQSALGWSRSEIAAGTTFALLTLAVAAPVAGHFTDRFGTRAVGSLSLAAYGLLLLLLAAIAPNLGLYYLLMVLIAAAAAGTTGVVFAPVVVARFSRSRGLALGILMSGTAILLLPLSPILQQALESGGWRVGYALLGVISLVIGLPCAALIVKAPAATDLSQPTGSEPILGIDFRRALREPAFWKILAGTCAATLPLGGILNQMPAMLADKGLSGAVVAALLSLFAMSVIFGRIATGLLFDRLPAQTVAFGLMTLAASAAVLFALPQSSTVIAALAVMLTGCAMGAEADIQAYFAARQFGLRAYAAILGTCSMCTVACLGLGALWFGRGFDAQGSYTANLITSAVLLIVSGSIFASIRRPDIA